MVNTLADQARAVPAASREVTPRDNNPPLITTDELLVDHNAINQAVAELEERASFVPSEIFDDAEQGKLQDVIKAIDDQAKIVETTREGVKGPYLTATRVIDGYFKTLSDAKGQKQGRLDKIRMALATVGNAYLRKKEAEARATRQAEVDRVRKVEENNRRLAREAEEAAERLRDRNRPTAAAEKETVAAAHTTQAGIAAQAAADAEQAAAVPPADLARTRSDSGTLGTLAAEWGHTIVDLDEVPASKLWPYISRGEKEKAIRTFIKQNAPGKPQPDQTWDGLPGVKIFGTTKGVYR